MSKDDLETRLREAEDALAESDPDRTSSYWAKYLPVQPAVSPDLLRREAARHPNVINLKGRDIS